MFYVKIENDKLIAFIEGGNPLDVQYKGVNEAEYINILGKYGVPYIPPEPIPYAPTIEERMSATEAAILSMMEVPDNV